MLCKHLVHVKRKQWHRRMIGHGGKPSSFRSINFTVVNYGFYMKTKQKRTRFISKVQNCLTWCYFSYKFEISLFFWTWKVFIVASSFVTKYFVLKLLTKLTPKTYMLFGMLVNVYWWLMESIHCCLSLVTEVLSNVFPMIVNTFIRNKHLFQQHFTTRKLDIIAECMCNSQEISCEQSNTTGIL